MLIKKLLFISVFTLLFFVTTQNVFSDNLGYEEFYDEGTKKYGYKDSSGNIVIPAKFDMTCDFKEGLAAVEIGNKWGYINKTGKLVTPAKFDWTCGFKEGLAAVEIGNKWGYINKTGKLVIPAKFDFTGDFKEGLAAVKIGNKWGYINKTGKLVIPAKFDYIGDFKEGLADVKIGDNWGKINTQGVVVSMKNNNTNNTSTPTSSQPKQYDFTQYNACMAKAKADEKNDNIYCDSLPGQTSEGIFTKTPRQKCWSAAIERRKNNEQACQAYYPLP